jgi:hypothetical protein
VEEVKAGNIPPTTQPAQVWFDAHIERAADKPMMIAPRPITSEQNQNVAVAYRLSQLAHETLRIPAKEKPFLTAILVQHLTTFERNVLRHGTVQE